MLHNSEAEDKQIKGRSTFGAALHYVSQIALVVPDGLLRTHFPRELAQELAGLPRYTPGGGLAGVLEINIGGTAISNTDTYLVEVILIDRNSGDWIERETIAQMPHPIAGGFQGGNIKQSGNSDYFNFSDILSTITFGLLGNESNAQKNQGLSSALPQSISGTAGQVAQAVSERFLDPLGLIISSDRKIGILSQSQLKTALNGPDSESRTIPDPKAPDPKAVTSMMARRSDNNHSANNNIPPVVTRPQSILPSIPNIESDNNTFSTPLALSMTKGPTPAQAQAAVYLGYYSSLLDAELFVEGVKANNSRAILGTTLVIRRVADEKGQPRYRLFALTLTPDEAQLRCQAMLAAGTQCQAVSWSN